MRSHRDNRFNRGLQTAVKHIGRLEKRVDIQGFRLTTAGNWLPDYVLNFHGDCTMQIERARRLLRQRPEFAVVPQRMMQVVEQLLHYIQPDVPSLRLVINAGAVAEQVGRSKSAVIDALTWLVDFEFAAMERDGDDFWLELQPQFQQPVNERLVKNTDLCMGRFGDFPVRVGVKTKDVYESIGLMKVVKETEEGNGFWKAKVILMEPTEAGKAALMEYKTVKGGVGHCFKWANLEVASIDAVQDSKMAEGEKMVTYTAKVSKPAEWVSQPTVMEKLGYNAQELITRVSKRNTYIFFETKNGWEIR